MKPTRQMDRFGRRLYIALNGGRLPGARVDLSPEPELGYDRHTALLANGLSHVRVDHLPVPAAGHLGVQEVTCPRDHDGVMQLYPACPTCRAVV